MAGTDDELSYEEISEIRRKEENSSYISQIRPDFYTAATLMIRKNTDARNKILIENPDMYDGISSRYKNVSALLERVIFIRSNKIWLNALRDAAAGAPTIPDNLTAEERDLYMTMYNSAKTQFSPLNGSRTAYTPRIESIPVTKETPVEVPAEESVEEVIPETEPATEPVAEAAPMAEETPIAEEDPFEENIQDIPAVPPMEDIIVKDEEVLIRVLDDIPTFSGPERDYTLKKEDVVRLPSIMASALINRKMAVMIKTTQ